jgi:hypothetical protein
MFFLLIRSLYDLPLFSLYISSIVLVTHVTKGRQLETKFVTYVMSRVVMPVSRTDFRAEAFSIEKSSSMRYLE